MFCLTSLRRHLARIHSTNYKCEKCGKGFQEESRYKAHMEIHRLRECHLCGKVFARKQNADIHLIGIDVFLLSTVLYHAVVIFFSVRMPIIVH